MEGQWDKVKKVIIVDLTTVMIFLFCIEKINAIDIKNV